MEKIMLAILDIPSPLAVLMKPDARRSRCRSNYTQPPGSVSQQIWIQVHTRNYRQSLLCGGVTELLNSGVKGKLRFQAFQ